MCAANLDQLSASQIAAGVAAGDFTAVEVARAALDAVEQRDGEVQAFLQVSADLAIAAAEATDAARAAGRPLGPLAGVPVAFKDNMNLVGTRTTCASRMLEGYESPYTATCVQRLLDAGGQRIAEAGQRYAGAGAGKIDQWFIPSESGQDDAGDHISHQNPRRGQFGIVNQQLSNYAECAAD